jgi:hypothetical protein
VNPRCKPFFLAALYCLLACGRLNVDIALTSDGQPLIDAPDVSLSAIYCNGWTYCDTFDGDFSISTWQSEAAASGAAMAVTSVKSKSGVSSLRATRVANGAFGQYFRWGFIAPIKECEVDVFVVDTFAGINQSLVVADYRLADTGGFTFAGPIQAVVTLGDWCQTPLS